MFSDDEPELRDLIVQNLEKCGFLDKIKAELRAGVFLAIEEDGNLKDKIPFFNKNLDDYAKTSEGKIMLSLVREFLEYFNLNFTLSVFDPEISSTTYFSRSDLLDKFKLQNTENNGSILAHLLKDIIGNQTQNIDDKSSKESIRKPENNSSFSYPFETVTGLTTLESTLNSSKTVAKEEKTHFQKSLDSDYLTKISEEETKDISVKDNSQENKLKDTNITTKSNISEEANNSVKKENQSSIFKESKDLYSLDHDSFFDEPVPSEKTSLFSFSGSFKDKNEIKLVSNSENNLVDPKRNSLSSLRDLPSLSNNSWITNKDSKDNQQNLDVLKSFSDIKSSNIIESDTKIKEVLEKKDSDVIQSNEESSEKQISEESIEEEIEEDFSAGMEDLLNSSLSLAEDATTDQTISQVSVVDGVDHVEPCNS